LLCDDGSHPSGVKIKRKNSAMKALQRKGEKKTYLLTLLAGIVELGF
jgi:hypothetical protein